MASINENVTKRIKVLTGEVVSDKMDKTVVVKVARTVRHPMLQKVVHVFKKYKVHDEKEQAKVGDVVELTQGRPMSKTKYMYLSRIVRSKTV